MPPGRWLAYGINCLVTRLCSFVVSFLKQLPYDKLIEQLANIINIKIEDVVLPQRRDGKFFCLPHQTEGLINVGGVDKWAKGETTAANERRYILEMQQGKIDYKKDGINNMKYTYINTDIIFEKHKMINVHC